MRTGYSAIADGALLLALTHEILKQGLYDRDFLVRYTNAAELVIDDPARDDHGPMRITYQEREVRARGQVDRGAAHEPSAVTPRTPCRCAFLLA